MNPFSDEVFAFFSQNFAIKQQACFGRRAKRWPKLIPKIWFKFRKILENDIKIHTPNWESDRIADVDMILIKMGISEFLYFSSIPVRVSINEYIEIAKDYSTQKSGYFVNGVLDKLSREFSKDKRFVKLGRGLL